MNYFNKIKKVLVIALTVISITCTMLGAYAYGVNSINAETLKVEVIDTDGVTVKGTWFDPAVTAVEGNIIKVSPAQILKVTATLKNGGEVTVFSYKQGTDASVLSNDNIQYVGQEESGTIIKIRPRMTMADGEYVLTLGGDDVLTPYTFNYTVEVPRTEIKLTAVENNIYKDNGDVEGQASYIVEGPESADVVSVKIDDTLLVKGQDATTGDYVMTLIDAATKKYQLDINTSAMASLSFGEHTVTIDDVAGNDVYKTSTGTLFICQVANYTVGNTTHKRPITGNNTVSLKPESSTMSSKGTYVAAESGYFKNWNDGTKEYTIEKDGPVVALAEQTTAPMNFVANFYEDTQSGANVSDVISKAGAQWIKYKTEYGATNSAIRFVALMSFGVTNSNNQPVSHAGFVVSDIVNNPTIEAGHAKTYTKTVYEGILVRQGNDTDIRSAEQLKSDMGITSNTNLDSIFYAVVDINQARFSRNVYATPYIEFVDGTRIYGQTKFASFESLGGTL